MNAIKAKFDLAPKTVDEDYDMQKKSMKDLKAAIVSYKSAVDKAKGSVKSVVESLEAVRNVFEKLTRGSYSSYHSRDVAMAFGASYDRIATAHCPQFILSIDTGITTAMNELKKMHSECSKYEDERNRLRSEYDVYRNEVTKKEGEYAKKGKDLSSSKSYGPTVVKRNDLRGRFEGADATFKKTYQSLMCSASVAVEESMLAFLGCSTTFAGAIVQEFKHFGNSHS